MQLDNRDNREKIINTAKKLFLMSDFKNTSMRTIAHESGVGLSNIYNYFLNKDAIFEAIVKPLIVFLKECNRESATNESMDKYVLGQDDVLAQEYFVFIKELVKNYKDELTLLFLKASGSKFENFAEEYIQSIYEKSLDYFSRLKQRYPKIHVNISSSFIRFTCVLVVEYFKQFIQSDFKNQAEEEQFYREITKFQMGGWKRIMGV